MNITEEYSEKIKYLQWFGVKDRELSTLSIEQVYAFNLRPQQKLLVQGLGYKNFCDRFLGVKVD